MIDDSLIQRTKKIYDMLSDDISKQLYLLRMNFLISGDYSFVDRYVSLCHPDYPLLDRSETPNLMDGIPDEANVLFWGTGRFAEKVIPLLSNEKRKICFYGKDNTKESFHGYRIIERHQICDVDNLYIIPCTTKYYDDVVSDILSIGIARDHIIDIRKWFFCGTGDEYFYEDFLDFQENEVFIDAGCCDLESSIDFFRIWKGIEKIYAFEPDAENYRICKKRYEAIKENFPQTILLPYGTWDRAEELHFEATHDGSARIGEGDAVIKTIAIDDVVDKNDTVTYIKMDVEGAELRSLEGAKKTILKNRPKLAICIYHKPEDMITLPEFVLGLGLDYKLYIRSHSNAENEVVMYAV